MKKFNINNFPKHIQEQIRSEIEDVSIQTDVNKENTPKKHKYNANKTVYNGKQYDSKKESVYARKLDMLKDSPDESIRVTHYEEQVRYDIIINGIKCGFYKLDFKVYYADGSIKYIDVKGMKKGGAYAMFRLKKKIIQALYGIVIEEV